MRRVCVVDGIPMSDKDPCVVNSKDPYIKPSGCSVLNELRDEGKTHLDCKYYVPYIKPASEVKYRAKDINYKLLKKILSVYTTNNSKLLSPSNIIKTIDDAVKFYMMSMED